MRWYWCVIAVATLLALSPACLRAQNSSDSLRINEIMYAPDSSEIEWIELYDAATSNVSLQYLFLYVGSTSFTLPAAVVPANGYIVLVRDTSAIRKEGYTGNLLQLNLPALSNSGMSIVLRHNTGYLIDSITYRSVWGGTNGSSLERKYWNDQNDSTNWTSSIPAEGTPGIRNSTATPEVDAALQNVSIITNADTLILRYRITNVGIEAVTGRFDLYLGTSSLLHFPFNLSRRELLDTTLRVSPYPGTSEIITAAIACSSDTNRVNDTARSTIGAALSRAAINEIMYAPLSPEPEWIELFNGGPDTIQLRNAAIRNSGRDYGIPGNVILPPDSFLVLTSNDSQLRISRNVGSQLVQMSFGGLNNIGGAIALIDARGHTTDSVIFAPGIAGDSRRSAERIAWDRSGLDTTNWQSSLDSSGATPGEPNSVRRRTTDLMVASIRDSVSGTNATITYVLRNSGSTSIDSIRIILLSIDPVLSTPLAESFSQPHLQPGDSSIGTLQISLPRYGRTNIQLIALTPGDEVALNDSLNDAIVAPIPLHLLSLNEFMIAPSSTDCQWLECYSNASLPIECSTISVDVRSGANHLSTVLTPIEIASRAYLVVAADSNVFNNFPGLNQSHVVTLHRSSLYLASHATVLLRNRDSSVIDSLTWNTGWLGRSSAGGISLERASVDRSPLDSLNWLPSVAPAGATPLAKNSVSDSSNVFANATLSIAPNPFTPDHDGSNDVTTIGFTLASDLEASVNLSIVDMRGVVVRHLLSGRRFYRTGESQFDGRNDAGTMLPVGLYVCLFDATDTNGITRSSRTGIVIAKHMR